MALSFGRLADLAAWVPILRTPLIFVLSLCQYGLERVAEVIDSRIRLVLRLPSPGVDESVEPDTSP